MISLKRIVEQSGSQGQFYNLGKDFYTFKRSIDTSNAQIKEKFENVINSKLKGKIIRAQSSRGYKQFEKQYKFSVSYVTIDDYYDNFVVVAHDETGKKDREYFLKPDVKIQILGDIQAATPPTPELPTAPVPQAPVKTSPRKPLQPQIAETTKTNVVGYPIDKIIQDIEPWAKRIMKDTRIGVQNFVKTLGWKKELPNGHEVIMYDLTIPVQTLKNRLSKESLQKILDAISNNKKQYSVIRFDAKDDSYKIRIRKKVMEKTIEDKLNVSSRMNIR